MSPHEKLCSLRLARSENIGKSTFFRLVKIFGSPQKALEQVADYSASGCLGRKIKVCSAEDAEKELINSQNFGAEILTFFDEKYPRLLRDIPDPAPVLTVKGNIDFFDRDTIAIVGPRNASFGAINFAKKIASELAEHSIITVSGMARGVDTSAHKASLANGTIAVIAGGIDHIYPKENDELYAAISKQGLLVSENSFGMPPKGGNFVQRNRIISGLSFGVVVVEAGLKSGSLITARFAAEQGREVFSMPGSPFDPRCHGTNRLIKDGAKMIENIDDILEELPALRSRLRKMGMLKEPEVKEFIAPAPKMPEDDDVKKVRQELLRKLSFVPVEIEEIILELGCSSRIVNIALVQLELGEKIEVRLGKVVLKVC